MKVAIGADHRGQEVRRRLKESLESAGHQVNELGPCDGKSTDYPDVAYPVAHMVATGEVDMGILVCGTGIGMSIAANKVAGARAALVHDEIGADMSRRHNDANVLCLPADLLGLTLLDKIVHKWIATEFDGGRHARRVEKIMAIEKGVIPGFPQTPAVTEPTSP